MSVSVIFIMLSHSKERRFYDKQHLLSDNEFSMIVVVVDGGVNVRLPFIVK